MAQDADNLETVLGALERTIGRGSARIAFRYEVAWDTASAEPESSPPPPADESARERFMRGARQQGWRLFWWGTLRVLKRVTGKRGALRAAGIVDFAANRCMFGLDREANVTLVARDRVWGGPPGTGVVGLSSKPATSIQPPWLLDAVHGVTEANAQGEEVISGPACRRFAARVDLHRAAAVVGYDMALPPGAVQLDDVKRVALDLWVEADGYLRRIRHPDSRAIAQRRSTSASSGSSCRRIGRDCSASRRPTAWSSSATASSPCRSACSPAG